MKMFIYNFLLTTRMSLERLWLSCKISPWKRIVPAAECVAVRIWYIWINITHTHTFMDECMYYIIFRSLNFGEVHSSVFFVPVRHPAPPSLHLWRRITSWPRRARSSLSELRRLRKCVTKTALVILHQQNLDAHCESNFEVEKNHDARWVQ